MRFLPSRLLFGLISVLGLGLLAVPLTTLATVTDQDSSPFVVKNQVKLAPDMRTGAFSYSFPFTLPPGRNGLQPGLGLSYNSSNTDNANLTGYGWSLNIPTIERVAKYGTDSLYTNHEFTSALSGDLEDITLSDATHGTYGAKVDDGSFLAYVYNSDESWTVTDKRGTIYTFAADTSAQVVDGSDSTHVFRWYLTELRDTNDNFIAYTYTKDAGQVYPATITYTGHGSTAGIFAVNFTLASRADAATSYATGFSVKTSYRISAINVTENSLTIRNYALAYTTGINGVRSLLSTITETATDEATSTTITKPATSFDYSANTDSWTEDTSFGGLPITIAGSGSGSLGVYFMDVNGDALPDIVKSRDTDRAVYLNNGDNTWTVDTSITVPVSFCMINGKDTGVRVFDADGDGEQDLVYSRINSMSVLETHVYINNGDGTGWTEDTSIVVPIYFTSDGGFDFGVRVIDVDGDGMQDIVQSREGMTAVVYINNGDGTSWTQDTAYTVPVNFVNASLYDQGVRTFDVNADGLLDLVYSRYTSTLNEAVYINNGNDTGWTEDTNYSVPVAFTFSIGYDMGVRPMDINGDGLTDLVQDFYSGSSDVTHVYINDGDGTGWTENTSYTPPIHFTNGIMDLGVRAEDINGDGREDVVSSRDSGALDEHLYLASPTFSDKLTTVTTSTGASTTVTYQPSTTVGGNLSFPLSVVATETVDDGLGNTATTSYDFADGDYYYASEYDRKFAGFGMVTITDALGNVTKRYYHQGNATNSTLGESTDDVSKLWQIYREETYDSASHLFQTVIHSITSSDLGSGRTFVYENQTLELRYDADSDHTDTATTYTYESSTGNFTQKKEWGRVTGVDAGTFTDTGSDTRTTDYTYASFSSGLSSLVDDEVVKNNAGSTVQETKYYYDSSSLGTATLGNLTTEAHWTTGSSFVNTTYTYDSYGLLSTKTDALSNTTTFTPDTAELYTDTQTNALSQATTYTYDYSSGQVLTTTDANGGVFTTTYDALDRPLTISQPIIGGSGSVITKTFSYDDSALPSVVHETAAYDGSTNRETYVYSDGLGRIIQQRVEAEGTSTFDVTDTLYNELGQVASTTLPYAATGSSYTTPTTDTTLYQTLTYDALGRVTSSTDVEGTSTKSYEDWVVTETDALSKTKNYAYDAYGNLSVVVEHKGSTTYTTTYVWDALGRLYSLTDADGAVRGFSYDGLGRRLTAQDLHVATDTTFGVWTYTYDAVGNIATSYSPSAITTTYTYDALNRVATEDASSASGTEITYTYDSCTLGVGRLCQTVVSGGATTAYTYDELGRSASEAKTISSNTYTTSYTYDLQGNQATIAYPDGAVTIFTLGSAGRVSQVDFVDIVSSGNATPASNVVYAPNGKITSFTNGNGVTTAFTYDAADLYRLSNLTSTSGSSNIQNFTYAYDVAGNITQIVDASSLYSGMTISYSYDDLYRLTSAASSSTDSTLAYSKTWSYGGTGNILVGEGPSRTYGGTATGSYANPHAVTAMGTRTFTYDNNGNTTNEGLWSNTWNWRNQMTQSSRTGPTVTVTYAYDADGNRVSQVNGSLTLIYPNEYYSYTGTTHDRQIPLPGYGMVATSKYKISASTIAYHHHDHLGGEHVDTDSSGATLEYTIYSPYGATLKTSGTSGYLNANKFTGKQVDKDTGFYYYGARYYSANYGRFLSQDNVFLAIGENNGVLKDPQALDSYSYARNNPLRFVDPDGNSFWDFVNRAGNSFGRIADSIIRANNRVIAPATNSGYNFITLGAGDAASQMGRSGVTLGGLVHVGYGVAFGTVATSLAALDLGAAVGGIAVDIGLANRGQTSASQTVANKIANGHAYDKHAQTGEFGTNMTREEFASHVNGIIKNPSETKQLERGRTGYWDNSSKTTVVHDPHSSDGGTAFVPRQGKSYFDHDLK